MRHREGVIFALYSLLQLFKVNGSQSLGNTLTFSGGHAIGTEIPSTIYSPPWISLNILFGINQWLLVGIVLMMIALLIFFYYNKEFFVSRNNTRLQQVVNTQSKTLKDQQSDLKDLFDRISKLETINRSLDKKLTDHLLYAQKVLNASVGHAYDLVVAFPANSFVYPDATSGHQNDFCAIRKNEGNYIMTFLELNTAEMNKSILHLALNNFIEHMNPGSCHPDNIAQQIRNFIGKMPGDADNSLISSRLAILCMNRQTSKIKVFAEGMSVYIAIARNSEIAFSQQHEYHELQKLETDLAINTAGRNLVSGEPYEFRLKATDRIYIINRGESIVDLSENPHQDTFESDVVDFINSYQKMDIGMQGRMFKKEMRLRQVNKGRSSIPDTFSLWAFEI